MATPEPRQSPTDDQAGARCDLKAADPRTAHTRQAWERWITAGLGIATLLIVTLARIGDHPLWLDEAYSLGGANQLIEAFRATGGNMIGYYVLLAPWAQLSTDPVWLRIPSLVAVAVAVPFVGAIGRRLGGRWVALGSVLVFALFQSVDIAAMDARSYALEILAAAVMWHAAIRAIDTDPSDRTSRRWLHLVGALILISPLIHGLFLLCGLSVVALIMITTHWRARRAVLFGYLAGAVTIEAMLWVTGASATAKWIPPPSLTGVKIQVGRIVGTNDIAQWSLIALAVYSGIAALGQDLVARARRTRPGTDDALDRFPERRLRPDTAVHLAPFIGFVGPVIGLALISLVHPSFVARYLSQVTPMLAVAALLGIRHLARLARRVTGPKPAFVVNAAAMIVVAVMLAGLIGGNAANYEIFRTRWDEAAAYVAAHAEPGDALVFAPVDAEHRTPALRIARAPFEAAWTNVPHAITPEVISDRRTDLGQVKRIDHLVDPPQLRQRLRHVERVWVVTAASSPQDAAVTEVLTSRFDLRTQRAFPGHGYSPLVMLYTKR